MGTDQRRGQLFYPLLFPNKQISIFAAIFCIRVLHRLLQAGHRRTGDGKGCDNDLARTVTTHRASKNNALLYYAVCLFFQRKKSSSAVTTWSVCKGRKPNPLKQTKLSRTPWRTIWFRFRQSVPNPEADGCTGARHSKQT